MDVHDTCFSVLFVHYCRKTPLPTAYIPPACFSINLRHNTTPPSVFTTGLSTSHLRPEMKLRCNQAILSRLVSLAIFIGRSILLGNLSLPSPLLYHLLSLLPADRLGAGDVSGEMVQIRDCHRGQLLAHQGGYQLHLCRPCRL